MDKLLRDFMQSKMENGLLLIDQNTGSGKTFYSCHAMYNYIHSSKNHEKIYFVTTLKKNLPYEVLERIYKENGNTNFRKEVLVIKSNEDFVKENLLNAKVPEEYKRDEYSNLFSTIQEVTAKTFENASQFYKEEMDKRLKSTEKVFRKYLRCIISNEIKGSYEEKKERIKNDKRYKWIADIYPTVFSEDYKIYLLTVKKFLTRNDSLVKPSYKFISTENLKNAIVFIDEFDATKQDIQDFLIDNNENSAENNYLDIIKELHSNLHYSTPAKEAYEPYREYAANKASLHTLEFLTKEVDYIFEKYALNFNYKTNIENSDRKRAFLFFDGTFRNYLGNNRHYIRATIDNENDRVNIFFEDKDTYYANKKETDKNIYTLIREITNYLNKFARFIEQWSKKYAENENEKRKQKSEVFELFTLENAKKSLCNDYIKNESWNTILQSMIESTAFRNDYYSKSNIGDISFYNRGFKFFEFIDSDRHNEETKIRFIQQNDTPEKILLFICKNCKVIGLSATAKIDSVLSNYSLSYLKDELKENYVELSKEAYKRLNDEQQKKWNKYKDGTIKVNVEFVDNGIENKTIEDRLLLVTENKDVAQNMMNKLNNLSLKDNEIDYYSKRYCNIFSVIKAFIENDNIKSFLCLNMMLPKQDNAKFDLGIFKEFSEQYCAVYNKAKISIKVLESKDFESEKNSILEELFAGKKIFVFSSYKTIGAGQNLQYKIPNGEKTISLVNSAKDERGEKDFDAIYLGDVTNVITNLNEDKGIKALKNFLFEIKYLCENNEISPKKLNELVEYGFKSYLNEKTIFNSLEEIRYSISARRKISRDVIQAVGRLCRTNNKKENIYIYTSGDLLSKLDINCVNIDFMNPELKALFDYAKKYFKPLPDEKELIENNAWRISERAESYIKSMLQRDWNEISMSMWKELRECVLKYPTASKELSKANKVVKEFYIPNVERKSSYYYAKRGDFSDIRINLFKDLSVFKKELENKDFTIKIVSEEDARLQKIFAYKGMKDFFTQNGYATSFGNEDLILSPILFNNIYKGVLGEVAGKFILDNELNTQLKEISNPDYFEFFDFELKEGIYVDFKHWKQALFVDKSKYINHIAEKLKNIKGKKAYVINLLKSSDDEISVNNNIVEIPYLIDESGFVNEKAIKMLIGDMHNAF